VNVEPLLLNIYFAAQCAFVNIVEMRLTLMSPRSAMGSSIIGRFPKLTGRDSVVIPTHRLNPIPLLLVEKARLARPSQAISRALRDGQFQALASWQVRSTLVFISGAFSVLYPKLKLALPYAPLPAHLECRKLSTSNHSLQSPYGDLQQSSRLS
jgi:hypothetical protein